VKRISLIGAFISIFVVIGLYKQDTLIMNIIFGALGFAVGFLVIYTAIAAYFSVFRKSEAV
jgi:hypothetical protein